MTSIHPPVQPQPLPPSWARTRSVRAHAAREDWDLTVLDADEFSDQRYLENPVNRCFFCKSHLYRAIAPFTTARLVSGTNVDDLGDYRPGLEAADDAGVAHPYVLAGIDKAGVRAIAAAAGLADLADLPASPCLSSRIETGIAIEPQLLSTIDEVERDLTARLRPPVVRCRVRAGRVVIELDEATLAGLTASEQGQIRDDVAERWRRRGLVRPVAIEPYSTGSAFLRVAVHTASNE